ncbi:MAG: hypothetical protein V3T16_10895 [Gemmatimonadales bacterium]
MFEGWRERLEQLLVDLTPDADPRERSGQIREAMIDLKVGLQAMREGLVKSEREIAEEQRHLGDVERRGQLAAQIPDPETVRVAGEFAEKHRERITLLERKLAVQHDEIGMAEQDLVELRRRLEAAIRGLEDDGSLASVKQAWRELEAAGGQRPETDLEGELLQSQMDRQAREAAVEQQLAHLKRKLGRERDPT